ncbi:MAG: YbhB/YbcL family Raf kinase inhibitor-like protein [Betaproteobacteria bacterium]
MKLTSTAFGDGAAIPAELAFGKPDAKRHVALSDNRNPDLAWSGAPGGTRSFAVLCIDPDVPSRGDDVNREGRTVPATLPRVPFAHWVLVDLAPSIVSIARGAHSNGVTTRGKPGPAAPLGARHGINDYTGWFADDRDMAGDYYGYDGPCPPWNDAIAHRYVFTVYALGVDRLAAVDGRFGAKEAERAMAGHVLAQGSLTGRYTLNPAVRL